MADYPRGLADFTLGDATTANLVPMVVEQSSRGERAFDIFSRLLQRTGDLPRTGRSTTAWPR